LYATYGSLQIYKTLNSSTDHHWLVKLKWHGLPRLKPPWYDLGKVMTKLPGSWQIASIKINISKKKNATKNKVSSKEYREAIANSTCRYDSLDMQTYASMSNSTHNHFTIVLTILE
jgi:hypothetical protein